jgi:hypothetical protein
MFGSALDVAVYRFQGILDDMRGNMVEWYSNGARCPLIDPSRQAGTVLERLWYCDRIDNCWIGVQLRLSCKEGARPASTAF